MLIKRHCDWHIGENEATSETAFINRRELLKLGGIGTIGLGFSGAFGSRAMAQTSDKNQGLQSTADLYRAKLNPSYADAGRPITDEIAASTYNNFYEFGSHKKIWKPAQRLELNPWNIIVDGEVTKPQTFGFEDLLRKMPIEERIYRHRCVEAWAMTVPWSGFALAELVKLVEPTSDAKYVRFETFMDPKVAPGQSSSWNPWPYIEALTIEEASHELAFMVTGAYGKPMAKQFGAPIRLAVPWKYGFKHAKSIVKISFTKQRPVSFWETINASEYGFWANVNPGVPHPRWRQNQERMLEDGTYRATQIFNGYGEQVAQLYKDKKSLGEALYR